MYVLTGQADTVDSTVVSPIKVVSALELVPLEMLVVTLSVSSGDVEISVSTSRLVLRSRRIVLVGVSVMETMVT